MKNPKKEREQILEKIQKIHNCDREKAELYYRGYMLKAIKRW